MPHFILTLLPTSIIIGSYTSIWIHLKISERKTEKNWCVIILSDIWLDTNCESLIYKSLIIKDIFILLVRYWLEEVAEGKLEIRKYLGICLFCVCATQSHPFLIHTTGIGRLSTTKQVIRYFEFPLVSFGFNMHSMFGYMLPKEINTGTRIKTTSLKISFQVTRIGRTRSKRIITITSLIQVHPTITTSFALIINCRTDEETSKTLG